jgi:hypothetical protein
MMTGGLGERGIEERKERASELGARAEELREVILDEENRALAH